VKLHAVARHVESNRWHVIVAKKNDDGCGERLDWMSDIGKVCNAAAVTGHYQTDKSHSGYYSSIFFVELHLRHVCLR
jgi:hypothetical protein